MAVLVHIRGAATRGRQRSGRPTIRGRSRGGYGAPRATVSTQRQHVLQAMGLASTPLCTVRQVHGNDVCLVDAALLQRGRAGLAADALVTALPDVALGVLIADCLPVVLYALDPPVVAVAHAGRMGTYHRVVERTLAVMTQQCGTLPTQVHAVLGPAIGACCSPLDARAVGPFQEAFPATWAQGFLPQGPGRWTMDLLMANRRQRGAAGGPAAQIDTASLWTVCDHHDLSSHRAEGQEAGRGMAIVARTSWAIPSSSSTPLAYGRHTNYAHHLPGRRERNRRQ